MTYQTDGPLQTLQLNYTSRLAWYYVDGVASGDITLDAPYQRGPVWTLEQKMGLIRSFLRGIPIPAITVNDRHRWPGIGDREPWTAVIDGKQRIQTLIDYSQDRFAVPWSWWPHKFLGEMPEDTGDGPYVRFSGLSEIGQRVMRNTWILATVEATETSIAAEAEIYLLINGAGTPQTGADMANAARVAERKA